MRAVFLDRDGVMVEQVPYLSRWEEFRIFPWTARAVRKLKDAGFKVFVVSNQSGINRGLIEEEFVEAANFALFEWIRMQGAELDAVLFCPHTPEERCPCRKPLPGMLYAALSRCDIDLRDSYVVGDMQCDIDLAANVGAKGILVLTGLGYETRCAMCRTKGIIPNQVSDNLERAADWIIEDSEKRIA